MFNKYVLNIFMINNFLNKKIKKNILRINKIHTMKTENIVSLTIKNDEPKVYKDIKKSPNDKKFYKGLLLNNRMKVLLISDPEADKSAAALDVNIGHGRDPEEIPGMAHLCEHMLFCGTKKYPGVNDYKKKLSQNGGSSNAGTNYDHTTYHFSCNSKNFAEMLDMFAQFFISPLFDDSETDKAINIVNQEFERNFKQDSRRSYQVEKYSANHNHSFSKFGTGNIKSLDIIPKENNINVHQELLKFYKTWYSANIMTLAVLGKESLDDLEKMVINLFSDVEDKNVIVNDSSEHPYDEDQFLSKWYIEPVADVRKLRLYFPSYDYNLNYKTKPAAYWKFLLNHKGSGSVLNILKNKGWINSLDSDIDTLSRNVEFFSIDIDLTEEGVLHTDEIVTMIFQYLNMVKKEGAVKRIFDEYSEMAKIRFRFKEFGNPQMYLKSISRLLQDYPIDEVLTASELIEEWKPELINSFANNLVPEKLRLYIIAENFADKYNETETWYGTKFAKEKVSNEIVNKWKNAGLNPDFNLPSKNEFIPTNFDLKENLEKNEFPVIIKDTQYLRLWFKQDDEFLVPKANLLFDFVSPLAYSDPINSVMTDLFVDLLEDSLSETINFANLADLGVQIYSTEYGFKVLLSGYNDKLSYLLERILNETVNFQVNDKRFMVIKENYIKRLHNFDAKQPVEHSTYFNTALLSEKNWMIADILNACNFVTKERLAEFIPLFLSKLHMECLFHGNLLKSESLEIANMAETIFVSSIKYLTPLVPQQMLLLRQIEIPAGTSYLYKYENKKHSTFASLVYYQIGLQSMESNALVELFAQIISESAFYYLRTKEKLGYIVRSGVRVTNGIQGIFIQVQSNNNSQHVENKIEEFIDTVESYVNEMPDTEFNKHKEALELKYLEKPLNLGIVTNKFLKEISNQQYIFDRANITVAYLKNITKKDILEFYKSNIGKSALNRKKLSIHVIPKSKNTENFEENNNSIVIDDIFKFKTNLSLYPFVEPWNKISRRGMTL